MISLSNKKGLRYLNLSFSRRAQSPTSLCYALLFCVTNNYDLIVSRKAFGSLKNLWITIGTFYTYSTNGIYKWLSPFVQPCGPCSILYFHRIRFPCVLWKSGFILNGCVDFRRHRFLSISLVSFSMCLFRREAYNFAYILITSVIYL